VSDFDKLYADLLKLLSDQISDITVRFDALRLTLEARDPEFQDQYEQRLQTLRAVWELRLDRNTSDLLKQIETERRRQLLDSHEGKEQ
jgi:hypothetical protein